MSGASCAAPADSARPRAARAASAAASELRIGLAGESQAELALAVRAGRPGALEAVIRTHQDGLFGYVRSILGDPDEAEEAVQDTFLRAHRALTTRYDEARTRDLDLRPWLFRIARNVSLNRLRSLRRTAAEALPEADAWHDRALRVVPDGPSEVEARERADVLGSALGRLESSARELLQLRFIEGLAYAEIAELAGGTEAAVRGKVFRALQRLRGILPAEEVTHAL